MAFAVLLLIGMIVAFPLLQPQKKLKVFQPHEINPKLVDESKRGVRENHSIADFELINQLGDTIRRSDMEGKIYVADFFFATCPTICPTMSSNIASLQNDFADFPEVAFLSHSVTPDMDSVPVLYEYAERYGARHDVWWLLTGDKKTIYELARKSYFAVLDEGDGGVQDFIHTENFVLVDTKGRLRGFYDGTDPRDISRLREEIKILLAECFPERYKV